jgi:hypothetical protein
MVKLIKSLIFIVVILPFACDLPWGHEYVETTVMLNLSIVNKLADAIHVKYIRPKVFQGGDSVFLSDPSKIEYRIDSFSINPLISEIDTITYKYNSVDYCSIDNWIVKDFRIKVEVIGTESKYIFKVCLAKQD